MALPVATIHPGYEEQLRVETLPEWASGYIDFARIRRLAEKSASKSTSPKEHTVSFAIAVDKLLSEIERSGAFACDTAADLADRLVSFGFCTSVPTDGAGLRGPVRPTTTETSEPASPNGSNQQPNSAEALDRPEPPSTSSTASTSVPVWTGAESQPTPSLQQRASAAFGVAEPEEELDFDTRVGRRAATGSAAVRRAATGDQRIRSTMRSLSRGQCGVASGQEDNAAASLPVLAHDRQTLARFIEVQLKTVRHATDVLRAAAPVGQFQQSSMIEAKLLESRLPYLLETILPQLDSDIHEALHRLQATASSTGGGGAGRSGVRRSMARQGAATAGASTVEAYDWVIKWHMVLLAIVIFVIALLVPIFPHSPTAHSCAAVILCIATLWITEAMPFFATALLIPLLAVPLEVLPGLNRRQAGKALLGVTFDHTQILVLGGLCLGKAIAKHKLERLFARRVLRPVANRPWLYLLVVMLMSVGLCAVVSNVAAPVLVMSVVQPSLWELDAETGAPQAILLAIAFACNFGGMLTPIASPQNVVAQQALGGQDISFVKWFAAALPIVTIGVGAAWAAVILIWKPFRDVDYIPISLAPAEEAPAGVAHLQGELLGNVISGGYGTDTSSGRLGGAPAVVARQEDEQPPRGDSQKAHQDSALRPLTGRASLPDGSSGGVLASLAALGRQVGPRRFELGLIIVVIVVTFLLWVLPGDHALGDTGVVALIPIVVFFGVGVLKKADFNSLSWHLIFLLSGGNMLGLLSKESGLLRLVIDGLRPFLETHGTFTVVAVLICCVALVTTFVSHTVAALLLMPVVVEVAGVNPSLPSAQVLVFLSVMMCSGSMAFPITSFPNVNSLLTESKEGRPFLMARHFLVPGLVLSVTVLAQLTTFMVPYTMALFPRSST